MAQFSFKQIEAFVAVAELASFRRAAQRLNTTQPNISARISGFETQLGQRLFDRDAGSVRLTQAGARLLPRARDVMRAMDGVLLAAGDTGLFRGVLRLGVTEMVVHSWLGQFLSALKARFANIDVDLTVDLSVNISDALFARDLDLALQTGPFQRAASGMMDLGRFAMLWVATPDLGFHDQTLTLQDLARHPLLTHAKGTRPYAQLMDHIASAPDGTVRVVASSHLAACLQMTREGIGVACLPEAMVRADLARGDLVALRYAWAPDDLQFAARFDADSAPVYVTEAAALAAEISHAWMVGDQENLST
ncbi:MAG: LysR family transcriptional regulator [Marinibacterium sp.]|nr:LysR family transcriptional regulator [Marinibacterium sp.]